MSEHIRYLLALPDAPCYNIKAVVQQTKVNISTLRAWEQRYGAPCPKRSDHGHRLYSQRDVGIIKWMKQCTDEGLAISKAVQMLRELDTLAPTRPDPAIAPPAPAAAAPAASAWPDIRAHLLEYLSAVDLRQAHLLVNTVCTVFPVDVVVLDLFEPLMVCIGEMWVRGEIGIAEEHLITNFVRQRLLVLIQLHAPFAHGPRLICGCAPGEQHELGLLMFALLMVQAGWEVIYLGQNVDLEGFDGFLMRQAPALVCIGVSLAEHMAGMLEVCRMVAALSQQRVHLAYSGRLFELYPELRERVPGTYLGNDLRRAVCCAEQIGAAELQAGFVLFADRPALAHATHR